MGGRRATAGRTAAQRFRALLAAKGIWAAEARVATTSGGNVVAFKDLISPSKLYPISAGTLAQATADAALSGAATCTFNGTQRATSDQPASTFKRGHDGTGYEQYDLIVPVLGVGAYQQITTTQGTGVTDGVGVYLTDNTAAVGRMPLYIFNAGATPVAYDTTPDSLTTGVGALMGYTLSAALWERRFGSAVVASGTPGTLSANSPSQTLNIGARFDQSQPFQSRWFGSYGFLPLTAGERAALYAYVTAQTGVVP
jgi:hypothetical protein